jgi:hypothetical protein
VPFRTVVLGRAQVPLRAHHPCAARDVIVAFGSSHAHALSFVLHL